tara:strand:- start:2794 stop:3081 length:288 start_codon:yes stop_codon:yes gene_type:complete
MSKSDSSALPDHVLRSIELEVEGGMRAITRRGGATLSRAPEELDRVPGAWRSELADAVRGLMREHDLRVNRALRDIKKTRSALSKLSEETRRFSA